MFSTPTVDLLPPCDPFVTAVANLLCATDQVESTARLERLFELRAATDVPLTPSDRALRLFALGCLHVVLRERRRRVEAAVRGTRYNARPSTGRQRCRAPSDASEYATDANSDATIDIRREVTALLRASTAEKKPSDIPDGDRLTRAIVEDFRRWRANPLFVSTLVEMLSEPAARPGR